MRVAMGGICDRGQRCHQTAIGGVGARKEGRYASRDVWTSTELSKSNLARTHSNAAIGPLLYITTLTLLKCCPRCRCPSPL